MKLQESWKFVSYFFAQRIYSVSRSLESKDIFSHRAEGTEPFRKLFSSDLQGRKIDSAELYSVTKSRKCCIIKSLKWKKCN